MRFAAPLTAAQQHRVDALNRRKQKSTLACDQVVKNIRYVWGDEVGDLWARELAKERKRREVAG